MKVLIVDDSDLVQTRLANAFIRVDESIAITQAGNCKEALELFMSFSPDIVILDIALPDGSGIELLKTFKKENRSVNVYMLTNFPTAEFQKICMDLGANQFFDKSNLSKLINSIL
jgi:DNA-binding response OmpR family regulator